MEVGGLKAPRKTRAESFMLIANVGTTPNTQLRRSASGAKIDTSVSNLLLAIVSEIPNTKRELAASGAEKDTSVSFSAPPPGFEPSPNSSKGCRAAVTPRRIALKRTVKCARRARWSLERGPFLALAATPAPCAVPARGYCLEIQE
jgi:hypothetical protein